MNIFECMLRLQDMSVGIFMFKARYDRYCQLSGFLGVNKY